MTRYIKPLFISLSFLLGGGLAMAQSLVQPMEHDHKMVQMPEGYPTPKLEIVLTRDLKSGFNLRIETRNFELEPPERANCCKPKILEGHAHIFINGEKVYRAYGADVHLPGKLFKSGLNQVMVSLNDHEHNTWSKGSVMVMSTLVINVDKEDFLEHRFASFGMEGIK